MDGYGTDVYAAGAYVSDDDQTVDNYGYGSAEYGTAPYAGSNQTGGTTLPTNNTSDDYVIRVRRRRL